MKTINIIFICLCCKIFAQLNKSLKNTIQVNQSFFNFAGSRIYSDLESIDLCYNRFINHFGIGLGINSIQLIKQGLEPISPIGEVARSDNLQLYYLQVLFSYHFINFYSVKNLRLNIDIAPIFLTGGQNSFYGEIDHQTLKHNSFLRNPHRKEYETKFNIYGRLGISYVLFSKYELGINVKYYLRYITPPLMRLPKSFSPYPIKNYYSSYFSISFKYIF